VRSMMSVVILTTLDQERVFECSLALATCRLCRLASLLSLDQQYTTVRAQQSRTLLAPAMVQE
jgi:hypothetical protein